MKVKRFIVRALERGCCFTHPIVLHRPFLWIPLPTGWCICPLATLSDKLDQRWGTHGWDEVEP